MAIEDNLHRLCEQNFVQGLLAAFITDKDGVVILKSAQQDAPENIVDPTFFTSFTVANNQASKLGLKQNRYIMSMYDQYQFVQYDSNPLIITVVASADANTGFLINFGHKLVELSKPLASAMQEKM
ncbi:Roadblock/LC7 domain-containing protein [Lichtheimia hyalospora FSU 10163]|nr:Roadblock/LC7 domain-containing protein [Lichtheimia hyalospora FSU 10163]